MKRQIAIARALRHPEMLVDDLTWRMRVSRSDFHISDIHAARPLLTRCKANARRLSRRHPRYQKSVNYIQMMRRLIGKLRKQVTRTCSTVTIPPTKQLLADIIRTPLTPAQEHLVQRLSRDYTHSFPSVAAFRLQNYEPYTTLFLSLDAGRPTLIKLLSKVAEDPYVLALLFENCPSFITDFLATPAGQPWLTRCREAKDVRQQRQIAIANALKHPEMVATDIMYRMMPFRMYASDPTRKQLTANCKTAVKQLADMHPEYRPEVDYIAKLTEIIKHIFSQAHSGLRIEQVLGDITKTPLTPGQAHLDEFLCRGLFRHSWPAQKYMQQCEPYSLAFFNMPAGKPTLIKGLDKIAEDRHAVAELFKNLPPFINQFLETPDGQPCLERFIKSLIDDTKGLPSVYIVERLLSLTAMTCAQHFFQTTTGLPYLEKGLRLIEADGYASSRLFDPSLNTVFLDEFFETDAGQPHLIRLFEQGIVSHTSSSYTPHEPPTVFRKRLDQLSHSEEGQRYRMTFLKWAALNPFYGRMLVRHFSDYICRFFCTEEDTPYISALIKHVANDDPCIYPFINTLDRVDELVRHCIKPSETTWPAHSLIITSCSDEAVHLLSSGDGSPRLAMLLNKVASTTTSSLSLLLNLPPFVAEFLTTAHGAPCLLALCLETRKANNGCLSKGEKGSILSRGGRFSRAITDQPYYQDLPPFVQACLRTVWEPTTD